MKKSRFSEQQIAFILAQADDGTSVEEVCRKAGISQQTYYRWRKKYAGLGQGAGVSTAHCRVATSASIRIAMSMSVPKARRSCTDRRSATAIHVR